MMMMRVVAVRLIESGGRFILTMVLIRKCQSETKDSNAAATVICDNVNDDTAL